MKIHTTNYFNTFIEVADDCRSLAGEIPPVRGGQLSIANLPFEMISPYPYRYTSDELLFHSHLAKKSLKNEELQAAKETFFSKGQACMRSSPLGKTYGWGIHYNAEGKIAIYGRETPDYQKHLRDKQLKIIKAMRSRKV